MPRRVLLVIPDVADLGELASALRARGLLVSNATEPADAVEQALHLRPDAVLFAPSETNDALESAFDAVHELSDLPRLRLVSGVDRAATGPLEALRSDMDHVLRRIEQAVPPSARSAIPRDVRGNLEQMPIVDLLQLLTMNRKSGALCITTARGSGEVHLFEGEIVDAVYRRLKGEKALYRLLGQREGHFVLVAEAPPSVRRIHRATSMLLMEGLRQVDELVRSRREISAEDEALLIEPAPAGEADEPPMTPLLSELAALLQRPRSVDELLDEIAAPDPLIMEHLASMAKAGRLRRIPRTELTTPLAPPEQATALRMLVTRTQTAGYALPRRMFLAAPDPDMNALAHSVLAISGMAAPADPPPVSPVPRALGTLDLGEGVELGIFGLPVVDDLAPVWALALPGAVAVLRIDKASADALATQCDALEIPLFYADRLVGEVDVAAGVDIAALVRAGLEALGGE